MVASVASPLGVSSGASLGAVLAICFGWREVAGLPAIGADHRLLAAASFLLGGPFVIWLLRSRGRRLWM